jgi:hypothetical protein
MTRRLNLGPLTIVHDEGIPLEVLCPSEQDGLPSDVCDDLLAAPAVIRRCEQHVEDEPVELDFE